MHDLDTKVDNIGGWLKALQSTVNGLLEIVHSWQGERRVYMLVLAGLHMLIGVVLISIWTMVSGLKSDVGVSAILAERVIGEVRSDLEIVKVKQNQLIKDGRRAPGSQGR